ncbi:hypothetical protein CVT24_005946 [Panaeolus cyanescens]|uniref:Endonuclease/exonuclease/phosphatase domain-containing protein n=1 Tax=Panaeolus cyanescens TaxID=181874 RepID=A0A409V8Z1_9AGAR|nr:hypothetical protein CVT24_005946 [Panaeolus cyanescens]
MSSKNLKRKTSDKSNDQDTDVDASDSESKKTIKGKAKPLKRAKSTKNELESSASFSNPPQPTNKTLPDIINFPPKESGTLRVACWNVSGLAATAKKGYGKHVLYNSHFTCDWTIFQAGTSIFSKLPPISIEETIPNFPDADDVKGRIITLEFEKYYIVGAYVVNAGQNLKTLDARKVWDAHFIPYIRSLDKKKPVILGGDLNVAPTAMDLAHPQRNWNKSAGYTEVETTAFKNLLEPPEGVDSGKFVDIWRNLHAEARQFTYFSYRFSCREKSLGWRVDMFVVSERIAGKVKQCEIRDDIYGASDHLPVVLDIDV